MSISEPTSHGSIDQAQQLMLDALPVREALSLASLLADRWCAVSNSAVLVAFWDGRLLQAALRRPGHEISVFNRPMAEFAETSWQEFGREVFGANGCLEVRKESQPIWNRVFEIDGECVGGLSILTPNVLPKDTNQLEAVSFKLVAQWHSIQQDLRDRKLEAMAEFAAGAGHEINNPIATIAGRAALLLKTECDPERRRALETIGGQAYRVRDMIGDAMTFARPAIPKPERIVVLAEIKTVLGSFQTRLDAAGIHVELVGADSVTLDVDREQFRVFMSSLIRNELEALSSGGAFTLEVTLLDDGHQQFLRMALTDDGPGLSEQDQEHLFDPFYSGRPAGRGLGFGLSKCWRIVRLHGGRISAGGHPDCGFWLHADWPLTPERIVY